MKRSALFLLGVAAAMLLSCNPVKPVDPHAFNIGSGMFVLNEGNYQFSNGSLIPFSIR